MEQITLKNRTIFCRDNLEVLRGINSNTIDLIYLNLPFNKKKQFTASIGSISEGASFQDYFREDIPNKTDLTDSVQSKDNKHFIFAQQQGVCNGCNKSTDFKLFDIDYITPKIKGGGDNIENLQLLCRHCNVTKGKKNMKDLKVRLKERHII